jgi:internalin A
MKPYQLLIIGVSLVIAELPANLCGQPIRLAHIEHDGKNVLLQWEPSLDRFIIEQFQVLGSNSFCNGSSTGQLTNRIEVTVGDLPRSFFRVRRNLQVVPFPDPNLKNAMKEEIELITDKILPDNEIYDQDLVPVTHLEAPTRGIYSLVGLESALSLNSISLYGNIITNIGPLASLLKLNSLNLDGNRVSDLHSLQELTWLKFLFLGNNLIGNDISVLQNLTNLTELTLWYNQVEDISVVARFKKLEYLNVDGNQVADLNPISNLTTLRRLYLGNNRFGNDITALQNLTNLTELTLWNNQVEDISVVARFRYLNFLNLDGNQVADLNPISNLTTLRRLYLGNNRFGNDITALQNLTNLTELTLWGNEIEDISIVVRFKKLEYLNVDGTRLADVSPISNLTTLKTLYAGNNLLGNRISAFQNLTNLIELTLYGNELDDISPISELSALKKLYLSNNYISGGISALNNLTNLTALNLSNNQISDLSALIQNAEQGGLGPGDEIWLEGNPLTQYARTNQVPRLRDLYGVIVHWP